MGSLYLDIDYLSTKVAFYFENEGGLSVCQLINSIVKKDGFMKECNTVYN